MSKSLNERQHAVLRQIVRGELRPTSSDATTIYALRSRGLVSTRSAYAYGTVEPTEAGRALVDNPAVVVETSGSEVRLPDPVAGLDAMSSPSALLYRLTRSADHRLVIADPTLEKRAAWRRLLYATCLERAVAGGMVLRHSGRSRGDLVIWLEPRVEIDATATAVLPVEIPERVVRPHSLVAALRSTKVGGHGWIDTRRTPGVAHVRIARSSKQRTIRILHALTLEALRRGHTIESHSEHRCPGGFEISIDGHRFEVTMYEDSRRVLHVLTATEEARKARGFDWARRWDDEATGRLVLRHGHDSSGPTLAADRVRWKVEDRLGDVMDQLEQLAAVAEQRRLDWAKAQRHEAVRREHEQQAAEDARLLRERVRRLDEQIDRWQHATRIRRFVTAARAGAAADATDHEWLDWANTYADSIDPVVAGATLAEP